MLAVVSTEAGNAVELAAIAAAAFFLELMHRRRAKKIERKVDSVDQAVNSRPVDQPKLYDIAQGTDIKTDVAVKVAENSQRETRALAQELGRKIDRGFGEVNRRFDGVDGRLKGIDDRVDAVDERSTANQLRIERETARLNSRIDEAQRHA